MSVQAMDKPAAPMAAAPAALTGLVSTYRNCHTTRDYIDLGLDCADHVLRVPRCVLGWVRLGGLVPQLGRGPQAPSLQSARMNMMDQVNQLEATLADCERQIVGFEQIEVRLVQEAGRCYQQGDTAQVKRLWEEVRTCRERQQLEEIRRQKVRAWQQELWREAHELQDMEQEARALQTLEQVNASAEARQARVERLNAAMTRARMTRVERAQESLEEETPQDFENFCAGLAAAALPPEATRPVRAAARPELA